MTQVSSRPGMCVVRCYHKHQDCTFCLYNNIFVKTINPPSTLLNAVLSVNDMLCSTYPAAFIQTEADPFRSPECTAHSFMRSTSPAFALSLSFTHFLYLFISRVCLATASQSEALQRWVNLLSYWREMEGQMIWARDAVRLKWCEFNLNQVRNWTHSGVKIYVCC